MAELLRTEDLVCGYNGTEVIKGMSFSVNDGDFIGIIGPNGSGKTTLFRAIAGVLRAWRGRVLYKNRDTSQISRSNLAKEVAVLPQFLEVSFPFTVEEFVMMGRHPHIPRLGMVQISDIQAAERAMSITDTLTLRKRKISELSGGERQRCLLAQGLAQEPRLLLLDEPTSHLDIAHQVEALDLIADQNESKGITVLVVLHDLNLASEYCKKLLLISNGRIYRSGAPEDVITYETIEDVYHTVVVVRTNPISSSPHVLPVPKRFR